MSFLIFIINVCVVLKVLPQTFTITGFTMLPSVSKGTSSLSVNVVARGLSILKILSKLPLIEVMQQEHANAMTGPIISAYFPTTLS